MLQFDPLPSYLTYRPSRYHNGRLLSIQDDRTRWNRTFLMLDRVDHCNTIPNARGQVPRVIRSTVADQREWLCNVKPGKARENHVVRSYWLSIGSLMRPLMDPSDGFSGARRSQPWVVALSDLLVHFPPTSSLP